MNSPDSIAPDWLAYLRNTDFGDKIDLRDLKAGDIILVATEHSNYRMQVTDAKDLRVHLRSDRPDRPKREMRLMGCTLGASSTISPDHLFCGGNLELNWLEGRQLHTFATTTITKLALVKKF